MPQDGKRPCEAGPLLYLRGCDASALRVAVLVVRPEDSPPPEIATANGSAEPVRLAADAGRAAWGCEITLPARTGAWYECDGTRFPVETALNDDLRIAYTSCDGMEEGDLERPPERRNAMWRRLCEDHRARPFALLLRGGDQIYADEVTRAHPLTRGWPKRVEDSPDGTRLHELRTALRSAFWDRYIRQFAQEDAAWIAARVPSLAMWDDHDICDGWGSLTVETLDSAIGRTLFQTARAAFILFQFGTAPDTVPAICPDLGGESLTAVVELPGLTLLAPDLRSERRPHRVMGERGWSVFRDAIGGAKGRRVLLLSSVPALGPRLALVEALMGLTRRMEQYEDDLRDQWQSRAHRAEWRDFLRCLIGRHTSVPVTVLSGEIHLATRGTMQTPDAPLHQLVASGITHPPPLRLYAWTLGALARLGEAPLPGSPIRLHPLPGRRSIYTAQRNYLVLARDRDEWSATWELEETGTTPAMSI